MHDVSELKPMEQPMESICLLAGGLAHDFNNALNIIYGNISFAKVLAGSSPAIVEALTDAEEACERAKGLGIRLRALAQGSSPQLRKFPRYEARLRIQCRCGTDPDRVLSHYCVNLSAGGIFIETGDLLPIDTPLSLEFILPKDGRVIRCQARVSWLNHPESIQNQNLPVGMGLQFIGLTLDDMDSIRRFIKNHGLTPVW